MQTRKFLGITLGILSFLAVTSVLASTAWARGAWGQGRYKTLYRFKGGVDGSGPSGLVFDAEGNLYGTTYTGGTHGAGTVFKLHPPNRKTVLYNFTGGLDGANPHPYSNLALDSRGTLYGTTVSGGALGRGTAFELGRKGRETVLYSFCVNGLFPCPDGASPTAGVLLDDAGNIYGTTWLGGDQYVGVVFKLTPDGKGHWTESVLHSFEISDGDQPYAGLVRDSANNLYGTTWAGGVYSWGTVFEIDTAGHETVLHSFLGSFGADGADPYKPPIFDAFGNLYGTAGFGGNPSCPGPFGNGCGTVWKLDTSGALTVLYTFGGGKDGSSPLSGVVLDTGGNLYGMTSGGGAYGYGVVFQLKPKPEGGWSYRVLHAFMNQPGAYPCSNLTIDGAGNLYGTTEGDGVTTFGSVFEITP